MTYIPKNMDPYVICHKHASYFRHYLMLDFPIHTLEYIRYVFNNCSAENIKQYQIYMADDVQFNTLFYVKRYNESGGKFRFKDVEDKYKNIDRIYYHLNEEEYHKMCDVKHHIGFRCSLEAFNEDELVALYNIYEDNLFIERFARYGMYNVLDRLDFYCTQPNNYVEDYAVKSGRDVIHITNRHLLYLYENRRYHFDALVPFLPKLDICKQLVEIKNKYPEFDPKCHVKKTKDNVGLIYIGFLDYPTDPSSYTGEMESLLDTCPEDYLCGRPSNYKNIPIKYITKFSQKYILEDALYNDEYCKYVTNIPSVLYVDNDRYCNALRKIDIPKNKLKLKFKDLNYFNESDYEFFREMGVTFITSELIGTLERVLCFLQYNEVDTNTIIRLEYGLGNNLDKYRVGAERFLDICIEKDRTFKDNLHISVNWPKRVTKYGPDIIAYLIGTYHHDLIDRVDMSEYRIFFSNILQP